MHNSSKKRRTGGSGRGPNITVNPPAEPKFIREMREKIAQDEVNQREERLRERASKIKSESGKLVDDGFTVVKLNEEDLTEEEYNRMKRDLETQYKLDIDQDNSTKPVSFEIDSLMKGSGGGSQKRKSETDSKEVKSRSSASTTKVTAKPKKKLIGLNDDDETSDED